MVEVTSTTISLDLHSPSCKGGKERREEGKRGGERVTHSLGCHFPRTGPGSSASTIATLRNALPYFTEAGGRKGKGERGGGKFTGKHAAGKYLSPP